MIRDLALGELQALAQKAARGAGRSFGVAEDAGHAVRWLSARGYDGAGALLALLRATDGQKAGDLAPDLPDLAGRGLGGCPLILGGYLSDTGELPETKIGAEIGSGIGPVLAPVLLAPFLAEMATSGVIVMTGEGVRLTVNGTQLQGTEPAHHAARVEVQRAAEAVADRPLATRVGLGVETVTGLLDFAARTYAPATEDSRLRGAGAGTTDAD